MALKNIWSLQSFSCHFTFEAFSNSNFPESNIESDKISIFPLHTHWLNFLEQDFPVKILFWEIPSRKNEIDFETMQ